MTRILAVEDDPQERILLARILSGAGHDPVLAATGSEALAIAESNGIQAMLVDLGLPDKDASLTGMRLVWRLRSTLGFDIPIAVVSGRPVDEAREAKILCIAKPYEPAQLLDIVGAMLQKQAPAHDAAALVTRTPLVSTDGPPKQTIETSTAVPTGVRIAVVFAGLSIYLAALLLQYLADADAGAMEMIRTAGFGIILGSPAIGTVLSTLTAKKG